MSLSFSLDMVSAIVTMELKQRRRRRQQERQKSNGFKLQNNDYARASRFLVHFLAVVARLQPESASFRVFRTQLQKKLPTFDEPNDME